MGESAGVGQDTTNWRDAEVSGLFNVIAIALSGEDGVKLSLSFDRGATFSSSLVLAAGKLTRLPRITIAQDYSLGLLFWDSDGQSEQRLMLVEGKPTSFDANNSPQAYGFGAPQALVTRDAASVPLVCDVKYADNGDAFVAYGWTKVDGSMLVATLSTTRIGCLRRSGGAGTFTGTTVEEMLDMVPNDPSLALLSQGSTHEVYIAYESPAGVTIRKSSDGGQTFPSAVRFGTRFGYSPRLFVRTVGGKTSVECVYVDSAARGLGAELFLFRSDGDLKNGVSYRLLEARAVTAPAGGTLLECLGWFGFDATELKGRLYVVAHTQRNSYASSAPIGMSMAPNAGTGAALAPTVLYPGMTQPVPPVQPDARNKLLLLELD
jgi:hypothetical protein